LNVVADFGRPSRIRLAVLADRGGRELPIQPDLVALPPIDVPTGGRLNVRFEEDDGRDAVEIEGNPS
ncbi:MAG: bifunctional pyr operon transcriptional regulator/uracil phosphoribosyltransferase, partial [Planctomycetota bacterium]